MSNQRAHLPTVCLRSIGYGCGLGAYAAAAHSGRLDLAVVGAVFGGIAAIFLFALTLALGMLEENPHWLDFVSPAACILLLDSLVPIFEIPILLVIVYAPIYWIIFMLCYSVRSGSVYVFSHFLFEA